MTITQINQIIDEVISETIRKVDGKYVVYPKKGGSRLGTHPTKEKALAQLRAIEANRKESIEEIQDYEVKYWALHADLFDLLKKLPHRYNDILAKLDGERKKALEYFWNTYFQNRPDVAEGVHDPMNPGILKKRLGKLSCTKVRAERSKLKDKGTTYAKALQRYLNYHCN
jgi:hypothetical protein